MAVLLGWMLTVSAGFTDLRLTDDQSGGKLIANYWGNLDEGYRKQHG